MCSSLFHARTMTQPRRMSAADMAATLSTADLHSMVLANTAKQNDEKTTMCNWSAVLVLPSSHRESAAYHVGVIAELMRRDALHRIQYVYAQGFSAVVAMVMWHKWDELCEARDDASILATWVTPMQAVLTQSTTQLLTALAAIGIDEDAQCDTDCKHKPRLYLCERIDNDSLYIACYDRHMFTPGTTHALVSHLLGLRRCETDKPPARFKHAVQVRYSLWEWISELPFKSASERHTLVVASSAHGSTEFDLYDRLRSRMYHECSANLMWCTIPYHVHRGNPVGAGPKLHRSAFEAPLEIAPGFSIHNGMVPEVMKDLIRWGEVCLSRKLNLLGPALESSSTWSSHTRYLAVRLQTLTRSNSWSAKQDCRVTAYIDDGEGDCRAMERDVRVTEPQYHQQELDQQEAWRENQRNPDHTARELSQQLAFFHQAADLTPRWPSQLPSGNTSRDCTDADEDTDADTDLDMEVILEEVKRAEALRNTWAAYQTMPTPRPLAIPELTAPTTDATMCQTFCSWLRGPPKSLRPVPVVVTRVSASGTGTGPRPTRPPRLARPVVPRLNLPAQTVTHGRTRRRTHKQRRRSKSRARREQEYESTSAETSEWDGDELEQAAFDSAWVAVDQNGGPTHQVAVRAMSRRHLVLEASGARTPRAPVSGLVDFVQTERNLQGVPPVVPSSK